MSAIGQSGWICYGSGLPSVLLLYLENKGFSARLEESTNVPTFVLKFLHGPSRAHETFITLCQTFLKSQPVPFILRGEGGVWIPNFASILSQRNGLEKWKIISKWLWVSWKEIRHGDFMISFWL